MNYFVNLPLSWIHQDESWLKLLFARHLNPELGLDAGALAQPPAWHRSIAARIQEQGLRCSVHLPFFMPAPGSADAQASAEGLEVLCRAAEIATIYQPAHMVGHPGYDSAADQPDLENEKKIGFEVVPSAAWLQRSASAWAKVALIGETRLFLENTYDADPVAVVMLLQSLKQLQAPEQPQDLEQPQDSGRPRVAMCFDVGHWHAFAGGAKKQNLEAWLGYLAANKVLDSGHLHLHDNDGSKDQHLGLGQGKIPFAKFFTLLLQYNLYPTFTFEPHDLNSLANSLAWMQQNPEMQTWLKNFNCKQHKEY